jgi:hypothetical protein
VRTVENGEQLLQQQISENELRIDLRISDGDWVRDLKEDEERAMKERGIGIQY